MVKWYVSSFYFGDKEGKLMNRTLCSRVNMLVGMRGLLLGYMLRKALFLMLPINRDE
jgi:hypothetical protein